MKYPYANRRPDIWQDIVELLETCPDCKNVTRKMTQNLWPFIDFEIKIDHGAEKFRNKKYRIEITEIDGSSTIE